MRINPYESPAPVNAEVVKAEVAEVGPKLVPQALLKTASWLGAFCASVGMTIASIGFYVMGVGEGGDRGSLFSIGACVAISGLFFFMILLSKGERIAGKAS